MLVQVLGKTKRFRARRGSRSGFLKSFRKRDSGKGISKKFQEKAFQEKVIQKKKPSIVNDFERLVADQPRLPTKPREVETLFLETPFLETLPLKRLSGTPLSCSYFPASAACQA
jgi:hypothetical protein